MARKSEAEAPVGGAQSLAVLRTVWETQQPKRASGGWWALSGFNTQFLITLTVVLRATLLEGRPLDGAAVERLSDALLSEGDEHRLLQVKKTLSKDSAAKAVREATELMRLSSTKLRQHLTFQIACEFGGDTAVLGDVTASDVFDTPTDDDRELLRQTLARFDPDAPIIEMANPRLALERVLWNAGIENPHGVATECLGNLLSVFTGQPSDAVDQVIFKLVADIRSRLPPQRPSRGNGRILLSPDFVSPPSTAGLPPIGALPRIIDVASGRYRERPSLLEECMQAVEAWRRKLAEAEPDPDRLPIFWIEGRPGDGKSVLMLQLVGRLLRDRRSSDIAHLRSAEDLFGQLATPALEDYASTQLCFMDDLYARLDPVRFDESLRLATTYVAPAIGLITCGPSYERRAFERAARTASVTSFTVAPPGREELLAFEAWYKREAPGTSVPVKVDRNFLLVGWLAQISHGASLADFSAGFRRGLEQRGLDALVRQIAAANGLGFGAPEELIATAEQEAKLDEYAESQMLLLQRIPEDGEPTLYLAHPELVWPMFLDWLRLDHRETPEAWGEELGAALVANLKAGRSARARRFVGRLIDGPPVADRLGREETVEQDFLKRRRLRDAAYRSVATVCEPLLQVPVLPLWLSALKGERLSGNIEPSPVVLAQSLLAESAGQGGALASVAQGLILLGEGQGGRHASAVASAADYMDAWRNEPPVIQAMTTLARSTLSTGSLLVLRSWLERHAEEVASVPVLGAAVSGRYGRTFIDAGLAALRKHPLADGAQKLAEGLLSHSDTDRAVAPAMVTWTFQSPHGDTSARVYQRLLASGRPHHYRFRSAALAWLEGHPDVAEVQELFRELLKERPQGTRLSRILKRWLNRHQDTAPAAMVVRELITQPLSRQTWLAYADRAAQEWQDDHRLVILGELIKRAPSAERVRSALSFLSRHPRRRGTRFLLFAIKAAITKRPGLESELQGGMTAAEVATLATAMSLEPAEREPRARPVLTTSRN